MQVYKFLAEICETPLTRDCGTDKNHRRGFIASRKARHQKDPFLTQKRSAILKLLDDLC